ncbi:type II secretion system F family protein [Trinickia soli]|uniref:type II secretion system F family protein n=1 Tax=Trinickia soli TaxID=380675 RepID=UPI003FA3B732
MSSGVAWLAALALLCVATALLCWQRGVRAQRQLGSGRFIDSRIAAAHGHANGVGSAAGAASATKAGPAPAFAAGVRTGPRAGGVSNPAPTRRGGASSMPEQAGRPSAERLRGLPPAIANLAVRAGLAGAGTSLLIALAAVALGVLWVAMHAGATAAAAATIAAGAAAALFVTARSQRRRLAIVVQLPAFLDGIVRLVTLGNSVPAAFQAALQTAEMPLRECLDHVSRMMRAGVEIDRALAHVALVYRTREFEFVGAVLRLSVKYGGRADVMLERMAAFMRDLEQAERELAAMSAETRLSAWVLVALPLLIGGFLVATNPAYFSAMWSDVEGRRFVYLAFVLQAAGGYVLYRMTRLRA